TGSLVHDSSLWHTISRGSLTKADALVYNQNGAGHIFIYSSGDGWGSMYAYECKGCSYGCVAGYRTAGSAYHGIRRPGWGADPRSFRPSNRTTATRRAPQALPRSARLFDGGPAARRGSPGPPESPWAARGPRPLC